MKNIKDKDNTKSKDKSKQKYKFEGLILSGKGKGKKYKIIKINKKKNYIILKDYNLKFRFIPFVNKKGQMSKKMLRVPGKVNFSNVKILFNK